MYNQLSQSADEIDLVLKQFIPRMQNVQQQLLTKYAECLEHKKDCQHYSQAYDPITQCINDNKQTLYQCLNTTEESQCLKVFKQGIVNAVGMRLKKLESDLKSNKIV